MSNFVARGAPERRRPLAVAAVQAGVREGVLVVEFRLRRLSDALGNLRRLFFARQCFLFFSLDILA